MAESWRQITLTDVAAIVAEDTIFRCDPSQIQQAIADLTQKPYLAHLAVESCLAHYRRELTQKGFAVFPKPEETDQTFLNDLVGYLQSHLDKINS